MTREGREPQAVASLQLDFYDGHQSGVIRPGKDGAAVTAALSVMISEAPTPFAHKLRFRMADGSLVVAKPRPQVTTKPTQDGKGPIDHAQTAIAKSGID
jgi:hypothetical protein